MAPKASSIQKLLAVREDIIADLNHHFQTILKLQVGARPAILKARLQVLEESYEDFIVNKKGLLANADKQEEEDLAAIRLENHDTEDKYLEALARVHELLPDQAENANNNSRGNQPTKSSVQLPAISIKHFSGKFEDWEEFSDTFTSYFNINSNVPECQKLLHLKSVLEEEPLNLIKSLKATNEHFKVAWDLLEGRYLNKRKIFETHFNSILQLPNLSSGNATELKRILDTTNSSLNAIRTHGTDIENIDPFIVHIVALKLDTGSKTYWAETMKGSKELPTWNQFKDFLEIRVNILEGMQDQIFYDSGHNREVQTFASMNERKIICTVCDQSHKPFQCPQLKDANLEQRKAIP